MSNRLNILIVMIIKLSVLVSRPSGLEGPGDHLIKLIAFKIDAAENEVFVFVPESFFRPVYYVPVKPELTRVEPSMSEIGFLASILFHIPFNTVITN
jgi:hypothetical protein